MMRFIYILAIIALLLLVVAIESRVGRKAERIEDRKTAVHFRCEACLYEGPSEGFKPCPKCGSEDIFPLRFFTCSGCGAEGEQTTFFPLQSADPDPIKEGWTGECPDCGSNQIVPAA
ncbi:MAG: hypothetical protein KW806_00475 [Candidatus Yanofskybacteria bacterium]|nr:hypothetical protein [Candidatus Yanofskybacteria bacterium]